MSKYIIRNCKALISNDICELYSQKGIHLMTYCSCKDTNCKIKQIVENLRQVAYACHCDNCDGCGYYNGCGDTECGTYQALKSLELLDIQEVE